MSQRNSDPSSRVIILIGLVVLGLLIAGGVVVWGIAHGFGPRKQESQSQTYTQAVTAVEVLSDSGHVTIQPGADGEVQVSRSLHWYSDKPKVDEKFTGTTFKVTDDQACNCSIDYVITVPAGVSVKVDVDSGDVDVNGITGRVDVKADSGSVDLRDLTGELGIKVSSGDVNGFGLTGPSATVDASSGNVDLTYSGAPNSLDLSVDSGDVEVTVPAVDGGYRTDVTADSGDVDTAGVQTNSASTRRITIDVDSGNATVKS